MSAKRAFFLMLGLIILLIALCAAGTYFGHRLLKAEGDKLLTLKLEKAVLDKQSNALVQARKDIEEYEGLETIAKAIVPQEKDQARTILEIVKLAQESGIELEAVVFPESQLGALTGKGTSGKQVDSDTTQLTAVKDSKGLYVMDIEVRSSSDAPVSYAQLLGYLERLEGNRRTAQIQEVTIQPSENDRSRVTFTLILNSYVRP